MSGSSLSIAHIASEMAPLVKVGGLADVIAALSRAQALSGHRVTIAIPTFPGLDLPAGWTRRPLGGCQVPWGMAEEPAGFELCQPPGDDPRVLLVGHLGERRFFDRAGLYNDPRTGEGYPDNGERFLFFARAALQGLKILKERFDILHAHDHQAGWVPCFVQTQEGADPAFRSAATVFTIHNLGYQGIYDAWVLGLAGFGRELFYPSGPFEFWGRVNFMKVGLSFADMLSTVSPGYAKEIQSSGEFGFGLEGLLARRRADLRGILNGVDHSVWDPARDPHLPHSYDRDHLDGKALVRRALAERCGFPERPDWPLIGSVSRLVEQKGFDLIEHAERDLVALPARFVVLGHGQPRYEEMFQRLAAAHPERFYFRDAHDEPLAHWIEGGCDLFLMPSRYEPCGLNQMYSLLYGTPPVVRAVGGLADTVEEFDWLSRAGTGFLFRNYVPAEMMAALRRALAIRRQPELWTVLQRNGMARNFSWRQSVEGYDRLYAEALERVSSGRRITLDSLRATT